MTYRAEGRCRRANLAGVAPEVKKEAVEIQIIARRISACPESRISRSYRRMSKMQSKQKHTQAMRERFALHHGQIGGIQATVRGEGALFSLGDMQDCSTLHSPISRHAGSRVRAGGEARRGHDEQRAERTWLAENAALAFSCHREVCCLHVPRRAAHAHRTQGRLGRDPPQGAAQRAEPNTTGPCQYRRAARHGCISCFLTLPSLTDCPR